MPVRLYFVIVVKALSFLSQEIFVSETFHLKAVLLKKLLHEIPVLILIISSLEMYLIILNIVRVGSKGFPTNPNIFTNDNLENAWFFCLGKKWIPCQENEYIGLASLQKWYLLMLLLYFMLPLLPNCSHILRGVSVVYQMPN